MQTIVTSSPAKVILFGEHGVNRQQPALATAVDLRTECRVSLRGAGGYSFLSGNLREEGDVASLRTFRTEIDGLRAGEEFDAIREAARDFFAPARYVLAHVLDRTDRLDVDISWRSSLPIGSGMGSGAAATTSMVLGVCTWLGAEPSSAEIVEMAWQGDVIAHGGVASSLDSSTSVHGGLVRYTTAAGLEMLPIQTRLPLVIGDTQVRHNTAALNTHVRRWLDQRPSRMQLFRDMGYLVALATEAIRAEDLTALGHLMNLHQLLQEKMGVSTPENERLIEAALAAGALGAKISGSGGGGIIIALADPDRQAGVAAAIEAVGGKSFLATTGSPGSRVEA
ncbi:MAG: mevalonate kinase [Caldilineaceae bacterium]|nr:mevalonate kinase [Caldilineaceae bacterium]